MQAETVPAASLHARLSQLRAEYQAARSSRVAQIYYCPPSRKWVRVVAHPQHSRTHCVIEFHNDCPCSKG